MDLMMVRATLGIYAVLLAVGGIMGFVKARSRASLVAGLGSALMALACLFLVGQNPRLAAWLGAILAGVLLGFFWGRFARSRKFMPAGLMILTSLVVAILLMFAAIQGLT